MVNKENLTPAKREKLWNQCTQKARIITDRNTSRFIITDLALSCCDIVHGGGGHWNNFENQWTAKRFADEVKVGYKTLMEWIQIKEKVYDKLTDEQKENYCYSALQEARRKLGSYDWPEEKVQALYTKLVNVYEAKRKKEGIAHPLFCAERYISNLEHSIRKIKRGMETQRVVTKSQRESLIALGARVKLSLRDVRNLIPDEKPKVKKRASVKRKTKAR